LIQKNENNAAALRPLIDSMFLSAKIFYSLNVQDLPEFFEDNMATFMDIWSRYLAYKNPLLDTNDPEEAGPLEKLRASICEIADLYTKRYEEVFEAVPTFLETVWKMLIELSLDVKNDIVSKDVYISNYMFINHFCSSWSVVHWHSWQLLVKHHAHVTCLWTRPD
jgi:exportin-2 (importin alpha re-exporter)